MKIVAIIFCVVMMLTALAFGCVKIGARADRQERAYWKKKQHTSSEV